MKNNYSSDNYSKHTTTNPLKSAMIKRFNRELLRILSMEIATIKSKVITLLDVGCGEGFFAKIILSEFHMIDYHGIDQNLDAIEFAGKTFSSELFSKGDIYKIDAPNRSYDLTICLEVLEHLVKPQIALAEIMRVTNRISIISVPNEPFFGFGNLLALKNIRTFGNPPDHINHWTKRGFKNFILTNGFQLKYISGSFPWSIAVITKD